MKQKLFQRFCSVFLCLTLLLTPWISQPVKAAKSSALPADSHTLTLGEAADNLLTAASKYNKSLPSRTELLNQFPDLKETDSLPHIELLVMTSQAFGNLPDPKGNNARLAPTDIDLSKMPAWALKDLKKLQKAGILAQSDLVFSEPVTGKEFTTILRRIYALYGSDLKDDFYSTVNKKDLDTKKIPAGETDTGGTYDQTILVQKQVDDLIEKIVSGSNYPANSTEQKIKTFYESAADFKTRNALGAKPIRKYLDAIDNASTLSELSDVQIMSLKEIASGSLLSVLYLNDPKNSQKIIPTLMPAIEPESFGDMESHMEKLLVLSGESKKEAASHVKSYMELAAKLKKTYNPSEPARYVSLEELQALLPSLDVKALITAGGDKIPKKFCLMCPAFFRSLGSLMQDTKSLPAIKTALKLGIITDNYQNLSQDFLDAFNEYEQQTMGQAPSKDTPKEIAFSMVKNTMGDYIDRLYVKHYFSSSAKKDVEQIVSQFIQVYKKRIQNLDWMSASTKKAAIEKLDSMKFYIGYPDHWDTTTEQLKITNDYFSNQINATKLFLKHQRENAAAVNKDPSNRDMKIPVATVNAYYDQFTNSMCFPAGILQAPAYDIHASLEENLGGIGVTIAHEISHAFDNTGAKYDKNGIKKDWWSKEDYKKFQKLCKKTEAFYDGYESAPGISISGSQTLGENIADIGGVACALDVLKQTKNPDYDAFFRAYAKGWLKCTTRARAKSLAQVDEHSSNNLRVNRVLANFSEFYDTYHIKPSDGMYAAPKDRIQIW